MKKQTILKIRNLENEKAFNAKISSSFTCVYFSKATTLDRPYGPAWLAFGHSFAAENEHDQAMAAYFTASQLMKG